VDVANRDWEDVATDDAGHLYLADTGNTAREHKEVYVHRLDEPNPRAVAAAGVKSPPAPLKVTRTWRLRFPGVPFDCESLFVFEGKGYLVSKLLTYQQAVIYQFDLGDGKDPKEPAVLEPVATIPVRFPVTAADVSPDGKRLVVLTVGGPYLFTIEGDVAGAAKGKPAHVTFMHPRIEGACFVPEGVLATSEDRQVFLFRYEQFGLKAEPATRPTE
jgi:hypothetical protein